MKCGDANVKLNPSPMRAAWILEGQPISRSRMLARSPDGTSFVVVWDCSRGRFKWCYDIDETLYVVAGDATLKHANGDSQDVTTGDIVYFPAGSIVEWTVHDYIRKVAFLRTPLPAPFSMLRRVTKKLIHLLRRGAKESTAHV